MESLCSIYEHFVFAQYITNFLFVNFSPWVQSRGRARVKAQTRAEVVIKCLSHTSGRVASISAMKNAGVTRNYSAIYAVYPNQTLPTTPAWHSLELRRELPMFKLLR
jgi:hypothetical protein